MATDWQIMVYTMYFISILGAVFLDGDYFGMVGILFKKILAQSPEVRKEDD